LRVMMAGSIGGAFDLTKAPLFLILHTRSIYRTTEIALNKIVPEGQSS
jgi:hypothetical protein